MYLYEITNKISGKGYVGITKGPPKKRWWSHKKDLRTGQHRNCYLQRAYDKYGPDAFEYKIRQTFDSIEDMQEAEKRIIIEERDRLYNIKEGGYSAPFVKHTEETKRKIGLAFQKPVVGMSIETGEIKEYISVVDTTKDGHNNKNIGKCCKLSVSHASGRTQKAISTKGWVWMYKSEFNLEEMNRRATMAKLRGDNDQSRSAISKSILDGTIARYRNCRVAAEDLGTHATQIRRACLWEEIKSCQQRVWVFADIPEATILLETRYLYALETFN